MRAKILVYALPALILATFQLAVGQELNKIPRIGYLTAGARAAAEAREEAFSQGLREFGYINGKNIIIEYRSAEANPGKVSALAAELVSLKVDLIVVVTTAGALAAKAATQTIPIVMRIPGDPVEDGLVASLARPGGNVTGLTSLIQELGGKRLELLKEVVPRLSRVSVLRNPESEVSLKWLKKWEIAGQTLGLQIQSVAVRSPNDIDEAFRVSTKQGAGAMTALRNPFINTQRKRIVDLAIRNRLPTIFDDNDFVQDGGLLFYGANLFDLQRRLAYFVDRILKGAKPADLPVERQSSLSSSSI
jgi:putative ABC transport system substrate-binding protein